MSKAIEAIEGIFLDERADAVKLEMLTEIDSIAIVIKRLGTVISYGFCDWSAGDDLENAIYHATIEAVGNITE